MNHLMYLMIVEGPYDKQRLSPLSSLFDGNKLVLVPFGTDSLVEKDYHIDFKNHIERILNKEKTNKLSDFDKIVQVCDTDGCFIKEEYIEEDKDINHIIYEEEKIIVKRLSSILKIRNYKKDNINEVLKEDKIKLYYNSTNIDHVFDNIQNPSDKEKKHLSIKMYLKYKNDGKALIKILKNLCPTLNGYKDSWNYIKKGFNSLSRCSNLFYFILENKEFLKNEYKLFLDEIMNK